MSILRDFEKRLEGAVEGFFARAFRSGLQPVELAKALQRYAANYQQVGLEGVFIPNIYRFTLAREDVERFSGFRDSLARELAEVVQRTADDRGWRMKGPPRIEIETGAQVRVGTYELRGKAAAPKIAQPAAAPPSVGFGPAGGAQVRASDERSGTPTTVLAPANRATLRVVAGPEAGRDYSLNGDGATLLGRLPECDIKLDDPSVSRRHARILRQNERWTIEDLGSTNGVRVNGDIVGHAEIHDGDRLDLGGVRLTFSTGS